MVHHGIIFVKTFSSIHIGNCYKARNIQQVDQTHLVDEREVMLAICNRGVVVTGVYSKEGLFTPHS